MQKKLIDQLIEFANNQIDEKEAKKYLDWSKNNLELALNYYFKAQERIQRKSQNQSQNQQQVNNLLFAGARQQYKMEKILKGLKDEYNKPIEEQISLNKYIEIEPQKQILNFQETNDISTQPQSNILQETKKEKVRKPRQQKSESKQIEQQQEAPQIEVKQQPKQRKQYQYQFPLYIGTSTIKGSVIGSHNLREIKDQQVQLQIETKGSQNQKQNGKKTIDSQLSHKIRIIWAGQEIGRLDNEFEKIFGSLEKYLKISATHKYSNELCKTMDPIYLNLDVYLLENAISDVTSDQIDDGQLQFLNLKEHFDNLYSLLNLTIIQKTLVDVNKKKITAPEIQEKINKSTIQNTTLYSNDPFSKIPKQMSINQFRIVQQSDKIKEQPIQQLKKETIQTQNDNTDLDNLFQSNEYQHLELGLQPSPSGLETELYEYQSQALTWLLQREGILKTDKQTQHRDLHPLWREYKTKQEISLYYNAYSGQTAIEFPYSSKQCHGGILADEMGLGKTVMFIALIHANPFRNEVKSHYNQIKTNKDNLNKKSISDFMQVKKKRWAKTLIIVPLTLLDQWDQEINLHSKNKLKTYQYYGNQRNEVDLKDFDIVLSTYGTISHENSKNDRSTNSVYNYNWYRIILDEAHNIKGRTIQQAKAVFELDAYYCWCSTGTPIQNKLNELFSLIHFIRLEPWSDYLWWNTYINKPYEDGNEDVFRLLQTILNPVLLRRTKKSKKANGDPILFLPEKHINLIKFQMTESERLIYEKVEKRSQDEVQGYMSKGILMSQYMKVFELLLRLRQICDHPFLMTTRSDVKNIDQLEEAIDRFLTLRKQSTIDQTELINEGLMEFNQLPLISNDEKQKYKNEILNKVKNDDIPPCPVCFEKVEDAVVTVCLHFYCRVCLYGVMAHSSECPICRQFLTREDYMTLPRESQFSVNWKVNYKRSSKIEKIMEIINQIGKDEKCVIFSQFIGMLELIEFDLEQQGIQYLRLDGKLNQKQRKDVLYKFKTSDQHRIFMVSLKAGGVGLNLTMANNVIMVDPWWNPAVEDQAIERIYRIGQVKVVNIYRLITEYTVEARILEMHKIKQQLFDATVQSEDKKRQMGVEMFKNILFG